MADEDPQTESQNPAERVQQLYEDAEKRTAQAMEGLVAQGSFGELLARVTENVVALTRIGNDAMDLVLRNLRLAGRQDVVRLARQLGRTEDKLERVLQEVENLQEELRAERAAPARAAASARGAGASNGRKAPGSRSRPRRTASVRSKSP